MKLVWHKGESTVAPPELQIEKTTVYFHKNIKEEQREHEEGEKETVYVYDEATLSKTEYARYLAEKNKSDIDYIAMEVGVDL